MRHKRIRISRACKVILILFIQAGIFLSHVPCAKSAISNQAEKLILGFEQSKLSRGAHTEGKLALVTTVAPVNRGKQTATYHLANKPFSPTLARNTANGKNYLNERKGSC